MPHIAAAMGIALLCLATTLAQTDRTRVNDVARPFQVGASVAIAVIVELFTSEGCSSCPPADTLLQRLAATEQPGIHVIPLGEHVDYWDRLGWKDRFSSAALTGRQQAYASRFNTESIYTPQMVVDGRSEFVGSDAARARTAIAKAAVAKHGAIAIAFEGGPERPAPQQSGAPHFSSVARPADVARPFQGRVSVTITNLPPVARGDHADILLAITEDHLQSDVKGGENRGRVLAHAAVVRQLTAIGEVSGESGSAATAVTIAPDWQREHLTIVVFVQERRSRAVLAAAGLPLTQRP